MKAESVLGFKFPDELRSVWLILGAGFLNKSLDGKNYVEDYNILLTPQKVAEIYIDEENFYQCFCKESGTIPFFEVGQQTYLEMPHRYESTSPVLNYFHPDIDRLHSSSLAEFLEKLTVDPLFHEPSEADLKFMGI